MATVYCGLACSKRPKIAFQAAICGGAPWLVQKRNVVLACAAAPAAVASAPVPASTARRDSNAPLRRASTNSIIANLPGSAAADAVRYDDPYTNLPSVYETDYGVTRQQAGYGRKRAAPPVPAPQGPEC